jgi:hypothetical protein
LFVLNILSSTSAIESIGDIIKRCVDEFEKLADDLLKTQPKLTKEQAFAKVYADPANVELRKAERAANGFAYPPIARTAPAVEESMAFGKLKELAAEFRRTNLFLTVEQCFARVMADPANRELVRAERLDAYDRMGGVRIVA